MEWERKQNKTFIIIIIIIIILITFMHGIYNYVPETNHVSTVHSVTAVLYLQSVLHVMLFRPWNVFCTFTLALPAVCVCVCVCVCVQWPIWLFFCSSLISCCPGMLIRYCLSDFEMVPVASIITSTILAFTFHMGCISSVSSWHTYVHELLGFFLDHISLSWICNMY